MDLPVNKTQVPPGFFRVTCDGDDELVTYYDLSDYSECKIENRIIRVDCVKMVREVFEEANIKSGYPKANCVITLNSGEILYAKESYEEILKCLF
jgi:hypothetical protein